MLKRIKKFGSIVIIILLLPYVVTVFINGVDIKSSNRTDAIYIRTGTSQTSFDEYCMGLLAKELPEDYDKEAVKAQAVLIRTNVYKQLAEKGRHVVFEEEAWSVKDMEKYWSVSDYSRNYRQVTEAWEETKDEVVTYENSFALTPYHKLSNGKTRNGNEVLNSEAYPYLASKDCPQDIEAEEQISSTTVSKMECEVTASDSAGYVKSVKSGAISYTGEDFRKTYGLLSSSFSVQVQKEKLKITTQGIGHGLGMSLYTANKMAEEGKKYRDIISFFFEGTEIKGVSEIFKLSE